MNRVPPHPAASPVGHLLDRDCLRVLTREYQNIQTSGQKADWAWQREAIAEYSEVAKLWLEDDMLSEMGIKV